MRVRKAFCAEDLRALAVLLIASAAVLMVCSMNSWLYPLNPWTDVNILGTMGRGMLNGQVLYRDLFDHKGPLIYFLFGLCQWLIPGTYHGLYLLEVLCCAGAMFFGWKTIRLYLPGLSPLWMVPLFAVLAGASVFSYGASTEELLLFPVAWSMYDLLVSWRGGVPLSSGTLLRNGVLAGCILWTKFNLLSFHFVWMAALAIDALVKEKKLWPPVRMCLIFLGGMAAGSIVEYVCSWGQEFFFGSRSWDYSNLPFNLNGRICLLYSVFWGVLGVLWIKNIYPRMAKVILRIPNRAGKILTWCLTAFLVFNAVMSFLAVDRWSQRVNDVPAPNAFWEFIDDRFPDERMEKIFANMHFGDYTELQKVG